MCIFFIPVNENFRLAEPSLSADEEKPQPKMFVGTLKSYQLKVFTIWNLILINTVH